MDLGCFASNFATANTDLFSGRARVRRVFDPYLPAVGAEAWRSTPAGVRPLWSCKAPAGGSLSDGRDWLGAIAGDYDAQYADLFAAFPADGRLTVCHEFETKPISIAQFRELTERLVTIFRANAPATAEYWIISDHWQWDPGHSGGANYVPDGEASDVAALRGVVDGLGIDVYAGAGRAMVSFAAEPGFQRWKALVGRPEGEPVMPMGVAERGITAETATTRADLLIQDAADAAELGLAFYSYWQAGGPAGDDTITDTTGKREMRMWAAATSGN